MIPQNQGSAEWLRFRKDKIGASEAAIIMGISPFKSIGQLWEEKLGIRPLEEPSDAMKRGTGMEQEAREGFEKDSGLCMTPKVLVHPTIPYMIASLDGISMDEKFILEIKCPGPKDHQCALNGNVPEKYIPQLQHIMSVTGHDCIFYYSFKDGLGKILTHHRNEEMISLILEREARFYECLVKGRKLVEDYDLATDAMKDQLYRIIRNEDGVLST